MLAWIIMVYLDLLWLPDPFDVEGKRVVGLVVVLDSMIAIGVGASAVEAGETDV